MPRSSPSAASPSAGSPSAGSPSAGSPGAGTSHPGASGPPDAPRFRRPRFAIRATDLARRQDTFLVMAICSVLGNRTFLIITGYPQLGNGTLHISHAIWGALMLAIAVILAISYLDPSTRVVVAILGGAGFGWFIDELGKFITRDVNYFFEPTIALIYLTFVGMYLAFRSIQRRNYSSDEAVANAIEAVKAAALERLEETTRRDAISLLTRTGAAGPLVDQLREILDRAPSVPQRPPGRAAIVAARIRDRYIRWTGWRHFPLVVEASFVALGIASIVSVISLALDGPGIHTFPEHVTLGTSIVSGLCYAIGAVRLRDDRSGAYRWFERGVLVAIFVTQVFVFAEEQLAGVLGLTLHLGVWIALRSAMAIERKQESLSSVA